MDKDMIITNVDIAARCREEPRM